MNREPEVVLLWDNPRSPLVFRQRGALSGAGTFKGRSPSEGGLPRADCGQEFGWNRFRRSDPSRFTGSNTSHVTRELIRREVRSVPQLRFSLNVVKPQQTLPRNQNHARALE